MEIKILCQPTRQQWDSISPIYFPHLERLYLMNSRFAYRTEKICQFIFSNSFSSLYSCSLPHISYELNNLWTKSYQIRSLQISIWDIRVYIQILHTCPNLYYLRIELNGSIQVDNLLSDSNIESHSALQCLIFHSSKLITCQFIDSILAFVPELYQFSLRINHHRSSNVSVDMLANILQNRIPKLKYINIDMNLMDSIWCTEQIQTKYPLFRSLKTQMKSDKSIKLLIRGSI